IKDCSVILETEDGLRDRRTISLGQNKLEKVNFSWIPKQTGRQKIIASVEHKDDSNPKNNQLTQRLEVKSKEEEKKEEISINIIRILLEGERQETLPSGVPLNVILEIEASDEFREPLDVNIFLEGEEFKQDFREKIPSLQKGRNKITFELLRELKPDKYNMRVELTNPEYRIRQKQEKNFVVEER
ncbi:MAG: hypothetical protein N2Z79_03605, partial [Candidatus Omnitrophica bacterium]|nr:hypothetical protein [Candidatus Omnitrophota bacterium]